MLQVVSLVQAPLIIIFNALNHSYKSRPVLSFSFTQIPFSPAHLPLWISFKPLFHPSHTIVIWGKFAFLPSPFLEQGRTLLSSYLRQSLSQKPQIKPKPVELSTFHCLCSGRDVLESPQPMGICTDINTANAHSKHFIILSRDFPNHHSFPYGNSYFHIKHLYTKRAAAMLRRSGHWNALIWLVYSKLSDDSA